MSSIAQIGQSSIASTSSQGIVSQLVAIARELAKEIGHLFLGTKNNPPPLSSYPNAPQYGKRFAAQEPEGTKLHGYRILGDKAKGVEPGFTARKDWVPGDDHKLLETGHAFNDRALEWLSAQTTQDSPGGNDLLLIALKNGAMATSFTPGLDEDSQKKLAEIINSPPDTSLESLSEGLTEGLKKQILQNSLLEMVADQNYSPNAFLFQDIKKEIMAKEMHFTELHYIKLDYYESDKTISGKYTLPRDKAKDFGIPLIGKSLHQLAKASTPREINRGAVIEKLANDVMGLMAMKTQKLEIIRGSHADGTTKLLLDGTHIDGFSDFDGEEAATKGKIYIKDGVLVQNAQNKDKPELFDGPPQLYTKIDNIAKNKIMMLLLGDRDALGSKGGNKGYVAGKDGSNGEFRAIDPGHAFEKGLLAKRGDVKSDLSFDRASVLKSKDYKNFTVFDQFTFAQMMEGALHLKQLQKSGDDVALFNQYIDEYNGGDPYDKDMDFSDEIKEIRDLYIERRDEFLQTLENRLAVYDFSYGPEMDSDMKIARSNQILNTLDGLEKLTSGTVGTAGGKKNGISLDIPQVKNGQRKEWNVQQSGNQIHFTFQGKTAKEAAGILKTLQDFSAKGHEPSRAYTFRRGPDDFITVSVKSTDIAKAQEALSYGNIMYYKHPETLKPWTPENDRNLLQAGSKIRDSALDWLEKNIRTDSGFLDGKLFFALKISIGTYIENNEAAEEREALKAIFNLPAETSQPGLLDQFSTEVKDKIIQNTFMVMLRDNHPFKMPLQEMKDAIRKTLPEFRE